MSRDLAIYLNPGHVLSSAWASSFENEKTFFNEYPSIFKIIIQIFFLAFLAAGFGFWVRGHENNFAPFAWFRMSYLCRMGFRFIF